MDRRAFLKAAGSGAMAWLLADCAGLVGSNEHRAAGAASGTASPQGQPLAAIAAGGRKPNVVVILADDLGYGGIGVQGCRDIPTPYIDSIAAAGVRFTDGYVSCPVCSPTRAGLLTGRYQQRFGHEFNPGPGGAADPAFRLPESETTFPERMKSLGYATGMVGKWHLGQWPDSVPNARGFDFFYGFLGGANAYLGPRGAPNIQRDGKPVHEEAYLTDAFGREAVDFIEHHKDSPFFLYLAFNAVHTPMQAFQDRLDQFASIENPRRRIHAAMLSAMDDAIGAVLDKLRELNLEQDTLVIFLSDNGGPTRANTSSNAPLRGFKGQVLEGGIRIPFMMQWKGRLPAGAVYSKPVISLDLLPTALAAAGGKVDPGWHLDGVNLLPFVGMAGASDQSAGVPHDSLFWRMGERRAIRQGDWKLVVGVDDPQFALYNLADDIAEENDLATAKPEKAAELESRWRAWDAEVAAPRWVRRPAQGGRPARRNRQRTSVERL